MLPAAMKLRRICRLESTAAAHGLRHSGSVLHAWAAKSQFLWKHRNAACLRTGADPQIVTVLSALNMQKKCVEATSTFQVWAKTIPRRADTTSVRALELSPIKGCLGCAVAARGRCSPAGKVQAPDAQPSPVGQWHRYTHTKKHRKTKNSAEISHWVWSATRVLTQCINTGRPVK